MYSKDELDLKLLSELKEIADSLELSKFKKLPKQELIYKILDQQAVTPEKVVKKKWEKPHQENLTGSPLAYAPSGSMRSAKATKAADYEPWIPQ